MMVDGAEEGQLKGLIDVLAPYTFGCPDVGERRLGGPETLRRRGGGCRRATDP